MRYDRLVVAYHGCERKVAEAVLAGTVSLKPSVNEYDWLGSGIYFWEYGPERALHFAAEQMKRNGAKGTAAVVGALIQLGECFDLLDTRFTDDLAAAWPRLRRMMTSNGLALPRNAGAFPDQPLRRRDCAALNLYLEWSGKTYDTVRCAFREGPTVFPGSAIYSKTHIQIAARNPNCVVGYFRPIVEEPP